MKNVVRPGDDATRIRALAGALRGWPLPLEPQAGQPLAWLYAPGEFEASTIQRLVDEGYASARNVHYVENFARPHRTLRLLLRGRTRAQLYSTDAVTAEHAEATAGATVGWWDIIATDESATVTVRSTDAGAPAVAVRADDDAWHVSTDGARWVRPDARLAHAAPHRAGEPTYALEAMLEPDGTWRFAVPALGRILVDCQTMPEVTAGESKAEASSGPLAEQRITMEADGPGRWRSTTEVAGPFVSVGPHRASRVSMAARSRPHARTGAFVCSDEGLTEIWQASARTLHLCMQGLLIDGIKRDRMPWAGDQALTADAVAYTFGDSQIVHDGLVALGRPTSGHVNGIVDYTLWWLIAAGGYARRFAPQPSSAGLAASASRLLADLARQADHRGVLRPEPRADGFPGAGEHGIFIDWGFAPPADGVGVALQILWLWGLRSGEGLLGAAGDPAAESYARMGATLEHTLRTEGWDPDTHVWRDVLGRRPDRPSAHPNIFAVLSGLDPHPSDTVLDAIEAGDVGTPYMRSFGLDAMIHGGRAVEAVDRVRNLWTPMLSHIGGTFWEEFPDAEPLAMYGRPYGKSLCHAWSAGPAALLPRAVLGVSATADGWSRFTVEPTLGALAWAAAVVPAPPGDIVVIADAGTCTVDVPAGTALVVAGREIAGPARHSWPMTASSA